MTEPATRTDVVERLANFEQDFDEFYHEPVPLLAVQLVGDAQEEITRLRAELEAARAALRRGEQVAAECEAVANNHRKGWRNEPATHAAMWDRAARDLRAALSPTPESGGTAGIVCSTHKSPEGLRCVAVPADRIIACRDALFETDADEAYHQLRMMVDPNCDVYRRTGDHWTDVQSVASGTAPQPPAVGASEAQFLLDRIAELEFCECGYDFMRDWMGHVEPAIARLRASLASQPPAVEGGALADIAAERRRQMEAEGWTPEHDDTHRNGEMAGAAACYVMYGLTIQNDSLRNRISNMARDLWPWSEHWWKPTNRRRDLVKAAALIVAEIERLDRAGQRQGGAG